MTDIPALEAIKRLTTEYGIGVQWPLTDEVSTVTINYLDNSVRLDVDGWEDDATAEDIYVVMRMKLRLNGFPDPVDATIEWDVKRDSTRT